MTDTGDRTLDALIAVEGVPDFIIDVHEIVWWTIRLDGSTFYQSHADGRPLIDALCPLPLDEIDASLYAYREGDTRIETIAGVAVVFGVGGDVSPHDLPGLVAIESIRSERPDFIVDECGDPIDPATDPDDLPCSSTVVFREGRPSVVSFDGLRIVRGYGEASVDHLDVVIALIESKGVDALTSDNRAIAAVLRIHRSGSNGSCIVCRDRYPCETVRAIYSEVSPC